MTDTYIKHLVIASGAEIKLVNRYDMKALAQLATWFASSFTKIIELNLEIRKGGVIYDLPLMIGWTVVRYNWHIYMACEIENDGEQAVSIVDPLI